MKRKTKLDKEKKDDDIVFAPTREIQDLGFSNIFLAYDESKEEWSLHLRYSHVVSSNNNDNNSSSVTVTTVREEGEQKQEEVYIHEQQTYYS